MALISIVDDDESVREAMKRLIQAVGLSAEAFASAEDFLVSNDTGDTACLILDLRLPGKSGLELQSYLLASGHRVPIIFISADGEGEDRARALDAGAIDFLQKPFSEAELFDAINSALAVDGNRASDAD